MPSVPAWSYLINIFFMKKSIFGSAIFYALLAGSVFMVDLFVDRMIGGTAALNIPHLILAVIVVIASFIVLKRAMQERKAAELTLSQARDELAQRVRERTNELERAYETLQAEMAERQLAEQARQHSLEQVELARQRAENLASELRMANNMLRTLIETLPIGMVITDQHGEVILANPLARTILGNSLALVNPEYEGDLPFFRLDGSRLNIDELPLTRALKQGTTVNGLEVSFHREDDSEVFIWMAASPVSDETGQIISAVKIIQDITERKQAEESLQRIQAELALGVQERATLKERQRLARELHDSVSQALYGISLGAHTAISLFDTDREKVLEALNYVISLTTAGITEMRALIFELRPESLEMEGLVEALTKQVKALRARHGIEVDLYLCSEPEVPYAVKEVLYRIAQEALQNAVKHARASRLELHLENQAGCLSLKVRDNGIGFNPQGTFPGHLGLRSMHERALSVGGTLNLTSEIDYGTQVVATIPVS
jgi:PAS domain S-box-containing protein